MAAASRTVISDRGCSGLLADYLDCHHLQPTLLHTYLQCPSVRAGPSKHFRAAVWIKIPTANWRVRVQNLNQ